MSLTNRRILLSCGVLLIVACLCASMLVVSGSGIAIYQMASNRSVQTVAVTGVIIAPSDTPTLILAPSLTPLATTLGEITSPTPKTTSVSTTTPPGQTPSPSVTGTPLAATPTSDVSPTLAATNALPAEWVKQMDTIQQQVLSYRQLTLKNPVLRDVLTSNQLSQKVKTDFFKNYTADDARKDARSYFAFGWLPANFDLLNFEINLQTEQVAGYYDNETKQMYIVSNEGFKGEERVTYSHEFTHILQDQNFDIKNGMKYSDADCKNDSERCAGIQALLEGDAVISETTWLQQFGTAQDRQDIQDFYNGLKMPVMDSAPVFFKDDLLFPYQQGFEFVQSIFDRGGYAAVNAAFKAPPVDTRQILHPDDYPAVKPVKITLLDLTTKLGGNWKRIDNGVLGEWDTYLLLIDGVDSKTHLPMATARTAAAGWSGDAYAVYDSGGSDIPILTLVTQWETANDAKEFVSAFTRYGNARWGKSTTSGSIVTWQTPGAAVSLEQNGQKTTWILAPNADVLQRITTALK